MTPSNQNHFRQTTLQVFGVIGLALLATFVLLFASAQSASAQSLTSCVDDLTPGNVQCCHFACDTAPVVCSNGAPAICGNGAPLAGDDLAK